MTEEKVHTIVKETRYFDNKGQVILVWEDVNGQKETEFIGEVVQMMVRTLPDGRKMPAGQANKRFKILQVPHKEAKTQFNGKLNEAFKMFKTMFEQFKQNEEMLRKMQENVIIQARNIPDFKKP
jgi:hypothetical protein